MWNDQKQILQAQLSPGERLLWWGQPRRGIRLRASDAFLIPFSLMWGGFAIFWEAAAFTSDAPLIFRLWGVPFVLVGLYVIFGRFIVDAKVRAKTYYGVTNERIVIVSGLFGRKIKSLNLRTLADISLDERADGSGTITFGSTGMAPWWSSRMTYRNRGPQFVPAFEMIQGAKGVYETIRNAQRQAT
jgi:hypothetical protein